jgi:hypothetical protein
VDGVPVTVHAHEYCAERVRFQERKHAILTPLAQKMLQEVELERWLSGRKVDSGVTRKGRTTT